MDKEEGISLADREMKGHKLQSNGPKQKRAKK